MGLIQVCQLMTARVRYCKSSVNMMNCEETICHAIKKRVALRPSCFTVAKDVAEIVFALLK